MLAFSADWLVWALGRNGLTVGADGLAADDGLNTGRSSPLIVHYSSTDTAPDTWRLPA
jgi:hypothetical protein